jgi:(1->4)-alpha-D-glucan 1-alpha-D-glucosylmutase
VDSIADATYCNSLNQVLLKVLSPGVPDIYQGSELWDFSLVDPDNRRAVDYRQREQALQRLERFTPSELWNSRKDGTVKLYFLKQLLALRARSETCFQPDASYLPIEASGLKRDRVVAFQRGDSIIGIATRWYTQGGPDFGDAAITLPTGTWQNVLAPGRSFAGSVAISDLVAPFPAAALVRQGSHA